MPRNSDPVWLWIKFTAARSAVLVLGLAAFIIFGVVVFELGAQGLGWLKTGSWAGKTIGDVLPNAQNTLERMEWIGLRQIGGWTVGQSVLWAYLVLGLACFFGYIWVDVAADELRDQWDGRHDFDERIRRFDEE